MSHTAPLEAGQASSEVAFPLTTAPAANSAPPSLRTGTGYPSADVVKARLEAAGTDPDHVDDILWLLARGRSSNLNQQRLGQMIGYDGSVVSRLFGANYPTDIQRIIDAIRDQRRLLAQSQTSDEPICDTWVLTEIAKFCTMVREARTVGILTGRSHTGKTTGLQVYTERNNHGRTIFVRMPPGGASLMFLQALARSCDISNRTPYDHLRDRLIRFFRPGMLLIVDEMHQTITGRRLQIVTLELLRDLQDIAGCGLVLCGTPIFAKSVKDARVGTYFEQIDNRAPITRKLPDTAPWRDVQMILEAYELPPIAASAVGEEIIRSMIREHGLGKLTKFLSIARRVARNRKELFGWNHVIGTDSTLKSWANGDGPQDEKGGRP